MNQVSEQRIGTLVDEGDGVTGAPVTEHEYKLVANQAVLYKANLMTD